MPKRIFDGGQYAPVSDICQAVCLVLLWRAYEKDREAV